LSAQTFDEAPGRQKALCEKFGADFCPPESGSVFGCALASKSAGGPLNGLRHPSKKGTSGWYVWWGETLSDADDFFQPLHIEHAAEECSEAVDFLALPPGWRFLIHGDYVDVWFDESLLDV
jgi:hypothetical protein